MCPTPPCVIVLRVRKTSHYSRPAVVMVVAVVVEVAGAAAVGLRPRRSPPRTVPSRPSLNRLPIRVAESAVVAEVLVLAVRVNAEAAVKARVEVAVGRVGRPEAADVPVVSHLRLEPEALSSLAGTSGLRLPASCGMQERSSSSVTHRR